MDKSLSNSKQKVETKQVDLDTGMPDLPKKELFAITFAFLGINMAFSLQSSQMSRICQTIGANPNNLGFFFIFSISPLPSAQIKIQLFLQIFNSGIFCSAEINMQHRMHLPFCF